MLINHITLFFMFLFIVHSSQEKQQIINNHRLLQQQIITANKFTYYPQQSIKLNKNDGTIRVIEIDTSKNDDHGVIFIGTQEGLTHIYYPQFGGQQYKRKQTIYLDKLIVESIAIYNAKDEDILAIGGLMANTTIFRAPINSQGKFQLMETIDTGNKHKQINLFQHQNSYYLVVCLIRQSVKIYKRQQKSNFILLQTITQVNLRSCDILRKPSSVTDNIPLLFITHQNIVSVYKFISDKFEIQKDRITVQKQSMHAGNNIFETQAVTINNSYDLVLTCDTDTASVFSITKNQSRQLNIQQKMSFKNIGQQTKGYIKLATISQDGYISILFLNNTVQLFTESVQTKTYQKFQQIQLKESITIRNNSMNSKFIQVVISNNHYQLIAGLDPAQLIIYLSTDTSFHKILILRIVLPIISAIIITALIIFGVKQYYRKYKQGKKFNEEYGTKRQYNVSEQNQQGQTYYGNQAGTMDQLGKQQKSLNIMNSSELHGLNNTYSLSRTKQQNQQYNDDQPPKQSEVSQIVNWVEEDVKDTEQQNTSN